MTLAALAALLLSAAAAEKAPPVRLAKLLNAPRAELRSLAELKGKVVYVEFWATWCAPCVAGIPRMNRLVESLAGQPVVFLAVTDEKAEVVEPFLKKRPMKAWVGLDDRKKTVKAYRVQGRPDGYLIGKDSGLLARLSPDELTEKDLRDAVAGRFAARPMAWAEPPAAPAGDRPIFEVRVSSAKGDMSMSRGAGLLEARGVPLEIAVAWVWDVDPLQVVLDTRPVEAVSFSLRAPAPAMDAGREALQRAVEASFGVAVVAEEAKTDAYDLERGPGPPPPPADAETKSGLVAWGDGTLRGKAGMAEAARGLWMAAGRPVVDRTGLSGEFAFDLEWRRGSAEARDAALAAAGLKLVPSRRKIRRLRVRPAGS